MVEYWRYLKDIKGVTFEQKTLEEYQNGKRVSKVGTDQVRIQVGDNYGNRIFTTKSKANQVYWALMDNTLVVKTDALGSFETIRMIQNLIGEEN